MSKYFNLAPECYLIIGNGRSAVYNLDTGAIIALDETQTRALALAESRKPIDEDAAIFSYLVGKEWGFYSSKPFFIDKARPMNVFGERRIWMQPMQFMMAILQLTPVCGRACPDCGKSFCPICFSDPSGRETLPADQWMMILDQLAAAGCKTVLFTGGECLLYDGLNLLIEHAKKSGLAVSLQTGGELPLDDIPEDVVVSVLINKSSDPVRVLGNLKGRKNASVIFQDVNSSLYAGYIESGWNVRSSGSSEPVKGKRHLSSAKLDDFFYKKLKDPCLNGKMFVLSDGSVVPCFQGRNEILGNLLVDDFSGLLQKLTLEYWFALIDDRLRDKRCAGCEFKYGCSACRFSNPEASCLYDPA